mmetsp:Transcript_68963/g.200074  ORF Transcript_68963/g.200074 Transcript_68963/m.200074 type:complete len:263 (+) Transcript_68963:3711-4499(+)
MNLATRRYVVFPRNAQRQSSVYASNSQPLPLSMGKLIVPATVSKNMHNCSSERTGCGGRGAPLAQRTFAALAGNATHMREKRGLAPRGSKSHHRARLPSSMYLLLLSVGKAIRRRRPNSTIDRWLTSNHLSNDFTTSSASLLGVQCLNSFNKPAKDSAKCCPAANGSGGAPRLERSISPNMMACTTRQFTASRNLSTHAATFSCWLMGRKPRAGRNSFLTPRSFCCNDPAHFRRNEYPVFGSCNILHSSSEMSTCNSTGSRP